MGGVKIGRLSAGGMTSADVAAMVQGATSTLQSRLTQAEQAASTAQSAAQAAQTTASAAQSTATTAKTTADAAQSTITTTLAPGYTSLSETAATVQSLNAASVADRQQLNTRVTSLEARATADASRITALEAKTWQVQRQTVSTSAALALGATVDLTVTWSPAMPDLNYLVSVTPDATGVLLSDIVAVKSKSTTAVVVTVKALVALTAGVKVVVEAGRWG